MKGDDARELYHELRKRLGKGWQADFPDKDVDEYSRAINWTVTLSQRNNLGQPFHVPQRDRLLAGTLGSANL